ARCSTDRHTGRRAATPGAGRPARQSEWEAPRTRAARGQLTIPRLIVLTVEIDGAPAEQSIDDLQRLLEAAHTMVERETKGAILRLVIAGAEAEDQSSVADLLDRVGHLG